MQINISTSSKNKDIVTQLTRKLPGNVKENVIARIALGYSLCKGKRFEPKDFSLNDSQGKEYKEHTLFDAKYKDFYIALICQAYRISKNDEHIPKYIKLHIDHGLEKINELFEGNPQYAFFDFFSDYFVDGSEMLEDTSVSFGSVKNNNQHIEKSVFSGQVRIKVGYNISTGEEICCCINDTKRYSNQHIAVAGKSGSGKTQFAHELLRQIHHQTQGKVNFLFLDFKGLSKTDEEKMKDFFEETDTECINGKPFPLNPVSFIDPVNENNKASGISKFADIIAQYGNLGSVQKGNLRKATKEAFLQHKDGNYPSLKEIYEQVIALAGDRSDSLTEIMDSLSNYGIFISDEDNSNQFLNKNYYFSLPSHLPQSVRFTSTFLIINYILNVFSNMGSTEVVDGKQGMRYVLMIDEAHNLFRDKKSLEVLEILLRQMRSYGVSIVLLSQEISGYNQAQFDFSQECDTSFLLPIKDQSNSKAIFSFLGLGDKEDRTRAIQQLGNLQNGQCVSNIRELNKGDSFEIVQYWQEKQKKSSVR